jgi:hypothetical protein
VLGRVLHDEKLFVEVVVDKVDPDEHGDGGGRAKQEGKKGARVVEIKYEADMNHA